MKELSLGQNIQLFSDDKFECISFHEKVCNLFIYSFIEKYALGPGQHWFR